MSEKNLEQSQKVIQKSVKQNPRLESWSGLHSILRLPISKSRIQKAKRLRHYSSGSHRSNRETMAAVDTATVEPAADPRFALHRATYKNDPDAVRAVLEEYARFRVT
jgi:hypothetical protein